MTLLLKMSSILNSQVAYNTPLVEKLWHAQAYKGYFMLSLWIFRKMPANELKWFLYETETTFLLDNLRNN